MEEGVCDFSKDVGNNINENWEDMDIISKLRIELDYVVNMTPIEKSIKLKELSKKFKIELSAIKQEYKLIEENDRKITIGVKELYKNNVPLDSDDPMAVNPELLLIKYDKNGMELSKSVNIDKVAEIIENKFNLRTIFGIKEETIEIYDDGIWSVRGKGLIKSEIEKMLKFYAKNLSVSEILEKVKRRTETSRQETEIIPEYKRCLSNGVLDLDDYNNIKLVPHSKDFNFRNKFNIEYDPNAKCDFTLNFLNQAFYEEDIPKFQEWLGLHLVRKYFEKKFAIFHGPKDTSKSVMVNLMTIFLNENVSGLSLQEISKGKSFDLLALKDKDANICDDLSSSDMCATGGIKMSVGDGFITGEEKFADKIKFRNSAKQTFACNKIPNPGEDIDDAAYYGRILLFPLENVITKEKQDKNLINKLTTKEELSGLLNWAIEGYCRLRKNNYFSNDKTPEENRFLMISNGNSLGGFAAENLEVSNGLKISKDEMYSCYCNWCLGHEPKLSPDSKEKLGRNLTKYCSYIQSGKSGSIRYWSNVKFSDDLTTLNIVKGNNNILVKDIIKKLSEENGELVSYNSISEKINKIINKKDLDTSLKVLKEKGDIFEPRKGYYQLM